MTFIPGLGSGTYSSGPDSIRARGFATPRAASQRRGASYLARVGARIEYLDQRDDGPPTRDPFADALLLGRTPARSTRTLVCVD